MAFGTLIFQAQPLMEVTSSEFCSTEHNDNNGQQQPGIVVDFNSKCNSYK